MSDNEEGNKMAGEGEDKKQTITIRVKDQVQLYTCWVHSVLDLNSLTHLGRSLEKKLFSR